MDFGFCLGRSSSNSHFLGSLTFSRPFDKSRYSQLLGKVLVRTERVRALGKSAQDSVWVGAGPPSMVAVTSCDRGHATVPIVGGDLRSALPCPVHSGYGREHRGSGRLVVE